MRENLTEGTNPPGIHVSYRAIAAAAGVSAQAVALAMRNAPGVSAETRKRIKQVALDLGYRPKPAMSALMREVRLHSSKREVLKMAFLNCWNEPFLKSKAEPLVNFYRGAHSKAEAMGYVVEIIDVNSEQPNKMKLNRTLQALGIDGILIFPSATSSIDLQLDWNSYSIVEVGQPSLSITLPLVTPDHRANMEMLCRKFLETGHRRIGLIHEQHLHTRVKGAFLAGFLASAWPDHRKHFVEPEFVEKVTKEKTLAYLRKHRCDALVISPHFDVGWLKDLYSVPETLSLGAFSLYSADRRTEVSGIDEQWALIGELAVEHLARRIQGHTRGRPAIGEVIMTRGLWVEGKTIANRLGR